MKLLLLIGLISTMTFAQETCPVPDKETGTKTFAEQCLQIAQRAPGDCWNHIQNLCQTLRPTDFTVDTYSDGTLLVNPRYMLTEEMLNGPQGRLFKMEGVNQANFENNIVPVFNALRDQLVRRMGPVDSQYSHLRRLQIRVATRERCERLNRPPVVAGIDYGSSTVTVCPLITHMNAKTLITILAHELGHSVDPCNYDRSRFERNHPFLGIQSCVSSNRRQQCQREDGEDETYADQVGALLAAEYVQNHPVEYSQDPSRRMLEYLHFRVTDCDYEPSQGDLSNFIAPRNVQQMMGCQVTNARCQNP